MLCSPTRDASGQDRNPAGAGDLENPADSLEHEGMDGGRSQFRDE